MIEKKMALKIRMFFFPNMKQKGIGVKRNTRKMSKPDTLVQEQVLYNWHNPVWTNIFAEGILWELRGGTWWVGNFSRLPSGKREHHAEYDDRAQT